MLELAYRLVLKTRVYEFDSRWGYHVSLVSTVAHLFEAQVVSVRIRQDTQNDFDRAGIGVRGAVRNC